MSEGHLAVTAQSAAVDSTPSSAAAQTTRPDPVQVEILRAAGAARSEAEAFIQRYYARAYGSEVRQFLPTLLALRDPQSRLLACLGFRAAASESLFLEHYLDRPVEIQLAAHLPDPVARPQLVEVGNMVAATPGGARWLITALTAYLRGAGFEWAVFTAVSALRNTFARLGVELVPLAAADKTRLEAAEQMHWGRYYDTDPWVVAARVAQSQHALLDYVRADRERFALLPVWQRAFMLGALDAAPQTA